MGLKKFFKKAGDWVKDKFHKAKNVVTKFAKPVPGRNAAIVAGIDTMELAKITGITPAMFILRGRLVF